MVDSAPSSSVMSNLPLFKQITNILFLEKVCTTTKKPLIAQKFEKLKTEDLSNTLDTLRNNKIEMIVTD